MWSSPLLELIAGSRLALVRQSPSPVVPPSMAPDLLLSSADQRRKQRESSKEENEQREQNTLYDIVSSPSKGSARLTLKLSRVKLPEMDQSEQPPPREQMDSDHEADSMNNNQLSGEAQELVHRSGAEEQVNSQQIPVRPNSKEAGVISGVVCDDGEMDALTEMDRIERESASERERSSKEVQDKGECLILPCAFLHCFQSKFICECKEANLKCS